jgi:hypothetical protein
MKRLTEFLPAAVTCSMRRGNRGLVSTHHDRYPCPPVHSQFFEDQYAPSSLTMTSTNTITVSTSVLHNMNDNSYVCHLNKIMNISN